MHQHLSACLSYLSVCLSAPFLAASTNRAVLAEYIKSIFVSIFVSFWLYSSHKIMCLCLFGVMMSYQMTWLTAAALIGGVLDCFTLPVMEDSQWWSQGRQCQNATTTPTTTTTKKTTLFSSPTAPQEATFSSQSLDILLCFVLNCNLLCSPVVFFLQRGEELWHILPRSLLMWHSWDKGHCEDLRTL